MINYKNTEQISKLEPYEYKAPKYGKSTTDPTYYEPAATRIANMKKAAGIQLEGIYDFYSKDDVSKFNEANFSKNISNASVDPAYVKGLTREEISQVTTQYENDVDKVLKNKQNESKKKAERINESVETSKAIENSKAIQDNYTSE